MKNVLYWIHVSRCLWRAARGDRIFMHDMPDWFVLEVSRLRHQSIEEGTPSWELVVEAMFEARTRGLELNPAN
jgi:hypothetical protein